jgi:nucleoside-diphosphate-sugar epimerase
MQLAGKTIAITGVGGFIGLRMAERARERGMQVRGMDINPKTLELPQKSGADCFVGSTNSIDDAEKLCRGADIVFHTAAIVEGAGDMKVFRKVNVDGTRTMAEVAKRVGCKTFVHLSSVMVYGFDYPENVDENGPLNGEGNPYCQTKLESDVLLRQMHDNGKLDVIVIRAGDVYGPRSRPWVLTQAQEMVKGRFINAGGTVSLINHVHVDNLIDAIFLALEKDAFGEVFNVTDDRRTTFAEYYSCLAQAANASYRELPVPVMQALFALIIVFGKVFRVTVPVDHTTLKFMLRNKQYSIAKARRVLGYAPRVTFEEGMDEVECYLRAQGICKKH